MNDATKIRLAGRLAEEARSANALASALWRFAEANGWRGEAGKTERFLEGPRRVVAPVGLDLA